MKYLLHGLRFPVCRDYDLAERVSAHLGLAPSSFRILKIIRRAVDTRKHNLPFYDFSVELSIDACVPEHKDLQAIKAVQTSQAQKIVVHDAHPLIAGMGPAGLFCALGLVENGLKPILIDRGDDLDQRAKKVRQYWSGDDLDPESNLQFGEGGAGAWSDGKLTSRSKDPLSERVFEIMTRLGAPAEIAWEALPHLGTDGIRALVKAIRKTLIEAGCEFHYRSKLEDIRLQAGKLKAVKVNGEWHPSSLLILAPGNASRDSFRMLSARGVTMEAKPFAAGFRIEQSQARIDLAVYGSHKWRELLGPASYRLTDRRTGTYSFCMCPGGMVVAAASEPNTIVCNGMSYADRGAELCNSAIVCGVDEQIFGTGRFAGMEWQERVEKSAWKPGNLAPAIRAEDFLKGRISNGVMTGSYLPGIRPADFSAFLPSTLLTRLRGGLSSFAAILRDFNRDAVLIAPETRTSSPLRFPRDPLTMSCRDIPNLFVIGEGSGYAGGIISSAIDGYRLGSRLGSE